MVPYPVERVHLLSTARRHGTLITGAKTKSNRSAEAAFSTSFPVNAGILTPSSGSVSRQSYRCVINKYGETQTASRSNPTKGVKLSDMLLDGRSSNTEEKPSKLEPADIKLEACATCRMTSGHCEVLPPAGVRGKQLMMWSIKITVCAEQV